MSRIARVVTFGPRRRNITIAVAAGSHVDCRIPFDAQMQGAYGLTVALRGKGASVSIRGGGVVSGPQQLKLTVDTVHEAPDTKGSTILRTVLKDAAQFDFLGTIRIMKRAQKSQDFLEQRSLLLDDSATATSVPALEILADNVKASHAASVAPIDPEQLFYLRSRGIPKKAATKLVIEAFLAPALVDGIEK